MMKLEQDTDREVDLHVHCSVCLEMVNADGPRSTAKLQCGHQFHLDCIGSAFNAKGIMQCPNCRNIEKGQWLYAIGSEDVASDITMDSWIAEQYPFFLVPYGFRICPVRGLMEMEDPSIQGDVFYVGQDSSSPEFAYFTYSRPHVLNPSEQHVDATPFDASNRRNDIHLGAINYPPRRHHLAPPPPTGAHMIERRSSNGFPAPYLGAGQAYDLRAWPYYPPPYVSTLPHHLQPGWARGSGHFPSLPSEPWLRHR